MKSIEKIIIKSLGRKPKTLKEIKESTMISYENLGIILKSLIDRSLILKDQNLFYLKEKITPNLINFDLEYRQFVNPEISPYTVTAALSKSDQETLQDILKSLRQFLNYCKKKNEKIPIAAHSHFYFGSIPISDFTSSF